MASMWALVIKNSGTVQMIDDLGIEIPVGQITLSDQFEYEEIASSDDLRNLVNNATLVVNDGTDDLSVANGLLYLTLYNAKKAEDKFYTKTALQTGGGGSAPVHWDNITNAPAFGSTFWLNPVEAMITGITADPPGTPVTGQYYIDSDDDHLYKYNGATWDDLGVPTPGLRVINLSEAAELIYEWTGSAWEAQTAPVDNNALLVDDAGDGKQAQYVYEESTTNWIKMADIDYGEPNDLDGAYDQGGDGVGRTIIVDQGAVKFDATSSTYAPLELTPVSALPVSGTAAGQLAVKDNILCVFDSSRGKWLSVQRTFLTFGRKGATANQYLSFGAGSLPSNNSGYRMPKNATVVSISGQLDSIGTAVMRLRSNDNVANIASLAITAVVGSQDNTVNANLTAGDFLQMYSENAASVEDPMIIVEIAYRP